ncbi:MAG: hypothetical protein AB7U20_03115 [Planctomycetaceae bacterium]
MGAPVAPPNEAPARSAPSVSRRQTTKYRLPTFQQGAPPQVPGRRWAVWLVAAIAFLAASAGWLWLVQDIPPRTAFIFFADAYPAPFAPPGWIDEDRDRFKSLDGLTLQVESAGFGSSLSGSSWDGLEAAVRATQRQIERSGVLIIDVRGLGGVDPHGLPVLIPPTADPFDPDTWIPLDQFCRQVLSNATKARQITLILDCLPARTRWASGWLENDFPAAVGSWAARPDVAEEFQRFTVFCRGGGGESRWRSRLQRSSVLQQALWEGLAGAADAAGNNNGRIELPELIESMRHSLPTRDRVAVHEFSETLAPLAHALPPERWNDLKRDQKRQRETAAAISEAGLRTAWQLYDQLMTGSEWRQDLSAAGRLLRALAWWEENLWSGRAGEAESEATTREVTRWLSYLSRPPEANSLPPGAYPLLSLQRHTGIAADQYAAAESQWNALCLAEDRSAFARQARWLAENDQLRSTALRQMASLLVENAPSVSWRQPPLIQRTLQQRQQYESLAVPEDIRASRHMAAQLGPLRELNLTAFDALQIGTSDQLAAAGDALSRADQLIQSCMANSEELHRRLLLCDRVRLELPFLAEWAAIRDASAIDDEARHVNRIVLPLITALNGLDAGLHPESTGAQSVNSWAVEVERNWELLRGQFEAEWERLLKLREASPDDLDRLELLLKVPLLTRKDDAESRSPTEQRIELLRKLFSGVPRASQGTVAQSAQQTRQQMLNSWHAHPALVLMGSPQSVPTSEDRRPTLEDWNHEFRLRIRRIEQDEGPSVGVSDAGGETSRRLLQCRQGLALARKSTNAWAIEYRHLAWADLLLWLADGALAEFWGPLPECTDPLMAQHVDRLLTAVSGLAPRRQQQVDALRERMTACIAAAENGLAVDAASSTPVGPQDRLSTRVLARTTQAGTAFPDGDARISVLRLGETFPSEAALCAMSALRQGRAGTTVLPLAPSLVESSFTDAAPPLRAEVWFRGNRFRSSFRIIPAGGRVTEADVDSTADTTFTVESRRLRSAAITFILDCSASMQELLPREGEQARTRKLTAAIAALQGLLTEVTDQPDANIGMMLYGHRASHDPKSQTVLRQQRYAERFTIPGGLQPFADVESILPPGRFGAAERGAVSARLERLLPWGETPLYLAVTRAAAEMQQLPGDMQRHLVVITDGCNYQFNPPPAQRVEFADALRSAQSANAIVHVIGFAIPAQDQPAAADEFGRLASQTGGTAHLDVSRATDLVKTLRALVAPASFTWKSLEGSEQRSPVNAPVAWKGPFPTRITVTCGAAVSELELHGGEAARLLGDAVGNAINGLESAEYLAFDPQFVPLEGGESGSGRWLVGVHQPRRSAADVLFEFSLKRCDRLFLKRPAGYAIAIQPLDAAGVALGTSYRYRGTEYAPRQPVPVVRIRAVGWPAQAVQADVRFSSIDGDTPEPEAIPLPRPAPDSAAATVGSIRGVQCEIRQTTDFVQCILRHQADSPGLGTLAVHWSAGPALKGVRRRVDPEARMEVHTFLYVHPEAQDASAVVKITPPPASELTMTRPLRVRLGREPGVITPADSDRSAAAAAGPAILR